MSPLARTIQIILLLAGLGSLVMALSVNEEKSAIHTPDGTSQAYAWECEVDTGTGTQECNGWLNYRQDSPNYPMTFAVIGVGLVLAAMTVTLGARRVPAGTGAAPAPTPQHAGPPTSPPPAPQGQYPPYQGGTGYPQQQ